MGVRFRHEVCEKWLREKTNVETVLQSLPLANFDPEFYAKYEQDVLDVYNKLSSKNLKAKQERSWNKVFSFLKS